MAGFVLSVLFAVLSNLAVYTLLIRRHVPLRHLWAGTPGYLYRVCLRFEPDVGVGIRQLALFSGIAFALAIALAVPLFMFRPADV
jgi:hypothetical protein